MKTVTQRGLCLLLILATLGLVQRSYAKADSTLLATTAKAGDKSAALQC